MIGVVAAGLLLAPLIVPVFVPWSAINCQHQDINIKTGQARYSRCLWFVKISEETKDTPLSAALQGELVDVADIKPWHRVNTFSPGVHYSPHYVFHGALYQANQMNMICTLHDLAPERKREIAKTILALWQNTGRDSGAEEYIHRLIEEGVSSQGVETTQ